MQSQPLLPLPSCLIRFLRELISIIAIAMNTESDLVSSELSSQTQEWKPHLTEPRAPILQTSLRARPPSVKSSAEAEQEELEKAPKFKARPLNKKVSTLICIYSNDAHKVSWHLQLYMLQIFESKGNLGVFCNAKKHVTIPQEFHFATDDRFPPPAAMCDMFDKVTIWPALDKYKPLFGYSDFSDWFYIAWLLAYFSSR